MNVNQSVDPAVISREGKFSAAAQGVARPLQRSLSNAALRRVSRGDARASALARGVVERIRERPLTSIVAALGIGFVVGGALSFRMGRTALRVATRYVARELLKAVL
jgi:hypothetical protein